MILTCGVNDCHKAILGLTGLLELQNLMRHVERTHQIPLTMEQALDWRAHFERGHRFDTELGLWWDPAAEEQQYHRPSIPTGSCPTYLLQNDGTPSIKCLLCGSISHHPKDVSELYCANCHRFHREPR